MMLVNDDDDENVFECYFMCMINFRKKDTYFLRPERDRHDTHTQRKKS